MTARPPRQILGRVLVVDDEPLNRDLLTRALGRDYQVTEAEDADAALRLLSAADALYDLVICDHLMPGKSGSDLARDIRDRFSATACILLTGYPDAPEVEAALADGTIFAIMGKPIVIAHLQAMVREALARR